LPPRPKLPRHFGRELPAYHLSDHWIKKDICCIRGPNPQVIHWNGSNQTRWLQPNPKTPTKPDGCNQMFGMKQWFDGNPRIRHETMIWTNFVVVNNLVGVKKSVVWSMPLYPKRCDVAPPDRE
jgi:hypothetical protein